MKRKLLDSEELSSLISRMIVPACILEHFKITDAIELEEKWLVELREKENLIPLELVEFPDVVLNGYCNSIEVLSHCFVLKPVYLKIYRRRWKRKGSLVSYDNTYNLHMDGLKIVSEMGLFFKK